MLYSFNIDSVDIMDETAEATLPSDWSSEMIEEYKRSMCAAKELCKQGTQKSLSRALIIYGRLQKEHPTDKLKKRMKKIKVYGMIK